MLNILRNGEFTYDSTIAKNATVKKSKRRNLILLSSQSKQSTSLKMKNEIILYQADELSAKLEVRIEDDTVWLTQSQMADLFQTSPQNITIHLRNIYK